MIRVKVSISA